MLPRVLTARAGGAVARTRAVQVVLSIWRLMALQHVVVRIVMPWFCRGAPNQPK
jgi:hypothetical protein